MPRSKAQKPIQDKKKLQPAKKNLASQKISRKSAPDTTGVKKQVKKRRARPGQAALREIKKYQKSIDYILRRAPLQRRIRQIAEEYASGNNDELHVSNRENGYRFSADALRAIQEAVESSVVSLYEDAYLCTAHAKRVTLYESDIRLAQRIRGNSF